MKSIKGWFSELHYATKYGIVAVLAGILLFTLGYISGSFTNISTVVDNPNIQVASQETPTAAPTQAPTEAPTQAPADTPTSAPAEQPTQAPAEDSPTGTPSTKSEILALYNESANKIKTNAASVTRNWEDLHSDDEYLQVPSALQGIAPGLMNTFLKKDETPLVWGTKDEIIANYPVKAQSYVSNATEADLADAQCTDDGTYYNITLKFNECTDPSGSGCDAAFNIIKPEEVKGATSIVQDFSVRYYDATIVCKIEKSTGNLVSATYTLPMVMSVSAKVLVTVDAQVGMTFIDDYTITY